LLHATPLLEQGRGEEEVCDVATFSLNPKTPSPSHRYSAVAVALAVKTLRVRPEETEPNSYLKRFLVCSRAFCSLLTTSSSKPPPFTPPPFIVFVRAMLRTSAQIPSSISQRSSARMCPTSSAYAVGSAHRKS
jgi:hypothetical protein